MQIADKYAPQEIEQKWYDYWERHGLFHSEPDAREPYTVVIPPPNVTGMLHMGHMLNNTLQDVLDPPRPHAGKKCLLGAGYGPCLDRYRGEGGGQAGEAARHREVRRSRASKFLEYAWEWKDAVRRRDHHAANCKQARALRATGTAPVFTMDEHPHRGGASRSSATSTARGCIYRGVRMVNWDPAARTALSDEEVVYQGVARQALLPALCGRGDPEQIPRRGYDAPRDHSGRYGAVRQSRRRALRVAAAGRPRGGAARRALDPGDPRSRMSTSPSVRAALKVTPGTRRERLRHRWARNHGSGDDRHLQRRRDDQRQWWVSTKGSRSLRAAGRV